MASRTAIAPGLWLDSPSRRRRLPWALLVSVGLHGAVAASAVVLAARAGASAAPKYVDHADVWVGSTVDIDSVEEPAGIPEAPAPPAPPAEPPQPQPEPRAEEVETPETQETDDEWLKPEESGAGELEEREREKARERAKRHAERATRRAERAERAERERAQRTATEAPSSAAAAAEGAGGAPAAEGTGSQGLPPGTRNLAKAFTRAMPLAGYHDRVWVELPLGPAGSAVVRLTVRDGKVDDTEIEGNPPEHLRRLIERTARHLVAGRFALARDDALAGTEILTVKVTLSQRDAVDQTANARDAERFGFEPPTPSKPGKAYFTLRTGRHFEAEIAIEKSLPAP